MQDCSGNDYCNLLNGIENILTCNKLIEFIVHLFFTGSYSFSTTRFYLKTAQNIGKEWQDFHNSIMQNKIIFRCRFKTYMHPQRSTGTNYKLRFMNSPDATRGVFRPWPCQQSTAFQVRESHVRTYSGRFGSVLSIYVHIITIPAVLEVQGAW